MPSKLSRRTFLKASAATGAMLAVSELPSFAGWQKARAAGKAEVLSVPSLCEMCGVKCGIVAQVQEGRVVKIDGNPKHPFSNGKLCARGNAGMKTLYDPDRLKQPLKRVGDGKFEPISWEDAIKEIGAKLKELKAQFGPETLVWATHPELINPWESHWMAAFGSPNLTGHAATCYASRSVAFLTTHGDVPGVDYGNVRYFLSAGRNLVEGIHNGVVQKIVAAKAKGAKLVALDPRMSNFATWADEWLPVKPGTDLAFLLALIHVIIAERLYDEALIVERTVGFDELKTAVQEYTPEWAAGVTGIPADTIARIARELAAARPASAVDPGWHGGFGSMYHNSVQTGRAAACLNALLGNLGAKGGLTFAPKVTLGKLDGLKGPKPPKPAAARWDGAGGPEWPLAKGLGLVQTLADKILSGQPYPIKALIVSHFNPVRSCPDTKKVIEALKKLDLLVAIDIQMSDTAAQAHYVLPESSYLERWDPLQVAGPAVALRQPVVKPLGDTKGEDEILIDLARATGISENFAFTLEAYNDALLAPLGVTREQLLKEGAVKVNTSPPDYTKLKTPSGKIEFSSEAVKKAGGSPVPVWVPPLVSPGKGQFQLIHGHVAMHTHTSTDNNAYLHALMPENELWIHAEPARSLGIGDGDVVEVESEVGRVRLKAKVTQAIRSDAVFMAHGFGGLSPQKRLAYRKGANLSELIPVRTAELSGAAAQCEVLVT
ncbi:MAG: molybdopterin-dependent oxidoreductase [Firmicutes bacterium]|nr:molybdopterin-dependent oxidoreductase [Bacillota bacterium]